MLSSILRPKSLALTLFASVLSACGNTPSPTDVAGADARIDGGDGAPSDTSSDASGDASLREVTYTPPARARSVEPNVRREVFNLPATHMPSANPATMTASPSDTARIQVVRYRLDTMSVTPAQAIVIAMPGFLSGVGPFDPIARALVRRGMISGHVIEVWAIDRRSNLLEDLRGMDAAESLRDPEVAYGYYIQRNVTFAGQRFRGFLTSRDRTVSYLSEWGLALTIEDLRAVVDLVPEPRAHVVLLGHSLGASLVEIFASWDFSGTAGHSRIAGMVLVDGLASGGVLTESQYRDTGSAGGIGFSVPGLTTLRAGGPYFVELPSLGVRAFALAEILARRAAITPAAVMADPIRDMFLTTLLGGVTAPPMTNAAAFGFGFDDGSSAISIAAMSLGRPDGPTTRVASPLGMGMLDAPSNPTHRYGWIDATATMPRELTPMAQATAAFASTPTNFIEWYFPTRLTLDVATVGQLNLRVDSWQVREGLRAMHGGEIDAPVLAIGAGNGIVRSVDTFSMVASRLTATVGVGRPNAGATRTMPEGFRAAVVPGMTHVDPLTASDDQTANPVPEWVATFAQQNTAGTVTVPTQN